MESASPQDVYARYLVSRRGYPLWTPEPSMSLPDVYRQQGLKIGDVGVVVPEDGSFDVFFNICLPPTHSLHRHTGVPNRFAPIRLEDRDIAVFPEAESAGRIISSPSVARIGAHPANETITSPLNYDFTLSSKEGALLILPEGAQRYYLRNQRPFLEEAIKHAVDWYNFAEDRLGRIISHDSLYLITGFYKACSWSLASYQQASNISGVLAQFKAVQVGGSNISRSYTWEATNALDWRVGPSDHYYSGIPNQSVFIQGFKIAVRSSILGTKRVKVKADVPVVRPHQVTFYSSSRRSNTGARASSSWFGASSANAPRETDAESNTGVSEESSDSSSVIDGSGEDVSIQHIPQVPKPFHPSDIINQLLLRSHPSAEIAITHDTQWCTLLEIDLLSPEELVQEGRLEELVDNMFPVLHGGVVYLRDITSLSNEIVDSQLGISALLLEDDNPQIRGPELLYGTSDSKNADAASTKFLDVRDGPSVLDGSKSSRVRFFTGPAAPKTSVPEGSKNTNTSDMDKQPPSSRSVMFKQRRSSSISSFPPDTLKPSRSALPKVPPEDQKSTTGLAPKPLKSILKGSKNAQPRNSYGGEDEMSIEMSIAKKMARFQVPDALPPGTRLGKGKGKVPMKPPGYDLYWMLLPYDPRRSRRLVRFDVAFPIDEIVLQDYGFRAKLPDAELNKPAANGAMTDMHIVFHHGPFLWELDIQNAFGIRCRDVFEAIYKAFNQQLTPEEQKLVHDRQTVEEAFRLRCRLARNDPKVERSFGWKRIDVVSFQTMFLGLTQPKSGGDWVLNIGTLPQIPGMS